MHSNAFGQHLIDTSSSSEGDAVVVEAAIPPLKGRVAVAPTHILPPPKPLPLLYDLVWKDWYGMYDLVCIMGVMQCALTLVMTQTLVMLLTFSLGLAVVELAVPSLIKAKHDIGIILWEKVLVPRFLCIIAIKGAEEDR